MAAAGRLCSTTTSRSSSFMVSLPQRFGHQWKRKAVSRSTPKSVVEPDGLASKMERGGTMDVPLDPGGRGIRADRHGARRLGTAVGQARAGRERDGSEPALVG